MNPSLLFKKHLITDVPRELPPIQPIAGQAPQPPQTQGLQEQVRNLKDYCKGLDAALQELWWQVAILQEAVSVQQGEITVKTGNASIVLKRDGTIILKGKDITIEGNGKISVKASGELRLRGQKIQEN